MKKKKQIKPSNSLLSNLLSKLPPPPATILEKKIELENYLQHDHFDYDEQSTQTLNKEDV